MDSIYNLFHGSSVHLQINCSLKIKILDHFIISHLMQCDNKLSLSKYFLTRDGSETFQALRPLIKYYISRLGLQYS